MKQFGRLRCLALTRRLVLENENSELFRLRINFVLDPTRGRRG